MDSIVNPIIIAHNEAVKILLQCEGSSQTIRHYIRKHLDEQAFSDEIAAKIQAVAIGVVRYQNTVTFIVNRAIPKRLQRNLSVKDFLDVKTAIFEVRWQNIPIQELASLVKMNINDFKKAIDFNLLENVKTMDQERQNSILYSHPTFLVRTLTDMLGMQEAIHLMEKNNTQATAYLRVNQLVPDGKTILSSLLAQGIILEQDKDIPFLYQILEGLQQLVKSESFKKGQVFIQDKASVIAVMTLKPKAGEFIWDACAAPGMKTHLLWELMEGQGQLVASDINNERMQEAKERFQSIYECKNIEWILGDASKTFIPKIRKILIDAPCTSTGILQSHPSYKWQLNKNWLMTITTIQNKILEGIITNYSNHPGTEILYSTCSILPHEGENQIDSVLKKFDNLELLEGPSFGHKGYSDYLCTNKVRRFFPHRDNSNGFFIAHLKIT